MSDDPRLGQQPGAAAPVPSAMRVEVIREGAGARVVAIGELDLSSADHLRDQLDRLFSERCPSVVLDLRELEFMDSTGLALIIEAQQRCREDGCELSLIQGPPQVRRLFEITGLADHLPFIEPRP